MFSQLEHARSGLVAKKTDLEKKITELESRRKAASTEAAPELENGR